MGNRRNKGQDFLNLLKTKNLIDRRSSRNPKYKKTTWKKYILKHIIIKLFKISDKENIFKAGIGGEKKRRINAHRNHRNKVSMTAYFSSKTIQARRQQ